MDESWRFRSIQANICPTCSISHFPFCPPPHSFIDRNLYNSGENLRRFPSEINPPFHRSLHDQSFLDHRMAPPMPPFPMPPARDPVPPASFHPSQRFLHEEFLERENFHKRMRVEDPVPSQPFNRHDSIPGRISLEDEWRLNLIRDHGQQNTVPIEGSWNPHRSIGIDHSFRSPGLGSNGRIGSILPQETAFSHHNHRLQPNTYEGYRNFPEFPRSQSTDRFVPHERKDIQIHMTGISKSGALNPKIGEQPYGRNGQFDSSWQPDRSEYYVAQSPEERSFHDSRPPVSYPISDYISRGPQEKYYAHDLQQTYPAESSSYSLPKQPQYLHSDSYHLMPNVVNHEKESSYHLPYTTMRHPLENKFELQNQSTEVMRTTFQLKPPVPVEIQKPFEPQTYPPVPEEFSTNNYSMATTMMGRVHTSEAHPPLPPQPLLPLPPEPSPSHFQVTSSVPTPPSMLSPVPASTSAPVLLPPNSQSTSEPRPLTQPNFCNEHPMYTSTGFANEGIPFIHHTPSKEHLEGRGQTFPSRHSLKEKPTVIDACHLFRQPHRASRPDHIVIILRGLPGSGKSYLAKALRDLEVETGGNAPRIHAMDDYFMMEVEKKVEDNEGSKSSSSSRGKKQITKKVIEYCYEPEMEEAYRSSMLKAFKKTLDEGNFTFVIVDDRNLRVADFAQFWAIAKRSGYEVYLLEATYKDPTGCAARNVHGFTVDDIQKMAEQWEEAPPLYLQLDIQSLFHGDNLNEHSIQEVDMDTDDAVCDEEETLKLQRREDFKMTQPKSLVHGLDGGSLKIGERWNAEEEELIGVKELGKSKWSKDVDEDRENSDGAEGNMSALSGLIQAYSKSEKSVHWGDQVDQSGFSIGAVKKQSRSSLVIGPGTGYNLDSNPLPEEEDAEVANERSNINESKRRFTEQLKAERESFKAVFDRRRQRIGGLWDAGDE